MIEARRRVEEVPPPRGRRRGRTGHCEVTPETRVAIRLGKSSQSPTGNRRTCGLLTVAGNFNALRRTDRMDWKEAPSGIQFIAGVELGAFAASVQNQRGHGSCMARGSGAGAVQADGERRARGAGGDQARRRRAGGTLMQGCRTDSAGNRVGERGTDVAWGTGEQTSGDAQQEATRGPSSAHGHWRSGEVFVRKGS
jgi:hypothetical protein